MAEQQQTVNPLSRLLSSRKSYLFVLALLVGLTILGAGLLLQARGDEGELLPAHSGDLAYLEIKAKEARSIEYVVLNQAGVTCDATAFIGPEITIADKGRIEALIVEDELTIGLCIRADYGYGNYLYKKYGDSESFIHLGEESAFETNSWGLRVRTGQGQSAEYVVLNQLGAPCDATAFAEEDQIVVVEDNQLVSFDALPPLLCFRANYSDHYVYEEYGRLSINFIEDRSKASSANPDAIDSLIALAPFNGIQYVIFNSSGRSCGANAFKIDQDFIYRNQPGEYEVFIEGSVIENAKALCFRADYDNVGGYIYEKYGGQEIVILPRYRLELLSEKQGNQLLIRSNTDVSEWRFVRSDKGAYVYEYDNTCDSGVFERDDTSEQAGNSGSFTQVSGSTSIYVPPTAYDRVPIESSSGNAEGILAIELKPEDYGLNYCIEAQDNEGSRAYLHSGIITSDLIITVSQEGGMLKATVNHPEQIVGWQVVQTSAVCSNFSFTDQANQKTEPVFKLTRQDHNRSYCFRATDKYGGHALQLSPSVRTVTNYLETMPVKQMGDVLLVNMLSGIDRKTSLSIKQWRFAKTSQPACDESVLYGATAGQESEGYHGNKLLSLMMSDIGTYFCFAIDYNEGSVSYHLSEPISTFETLNAGEGLKVDIEQYDDIILARASEPVAWSLVFRVPARDQCNTQGAPLLDSFSSPIGSGLHKYQKLFTEDNSIYFCFKIRGRTPGIDLYFVSEAIEGVEEDEDPYPYRTPTKVDSGQYLADFLRPYLTDKGQEILDGIDKIVLTSAIASLCGSHASGCYLENSVNGISVAVHWSEDYNDSPYHEQKILFRSYLRTFIHEFMHATDFQDPQIQGLRNSAWRCIDYDTGLVDVLGSGINNPTALQYTQCLDNSHPLLRQLRDLYDDLPENIELDNTFTSHQYLTAIEARWGSIGTGYWKKNSPSWYTELYAQSVFIRNLAPELEAHYNQYFKNRLDIIEAVGV